MLKPTKKNQKKWIKEHLNNGVFIEDQDEYEEEANWMESDDVACWEAMKWLDKSNVETLEEAWDKCTNVNWLEWCLENMMDSEDKEKYYNRFDWVPSLKTFRKYVNNPWNMNNWKKGIFNF